MKDLVTSKEMNQKCEMILKQHALAVTNELVTLLLDWPGAEGKRKAIKKKEDRMTKQEQDLFYLILENINWRVANSNIVTIKTIEIAYVLGLAFDENNVRKTSYKIREALGSLKKKSSVITIKNLNNSGYMHTSLFGNILGNADKVSIEINPLLMPYLEDFNKTRSYYTTLWAEDIRRLESFVGRQLYLAFKYYATNTEDKRKKDKLELEFRTIQLKSEFFCCEKADYTHATKTKEITFNRSLWEKRQLDKACEDINKNSKYIKILPQVDNKGKIHFYRKTTKSSDARKIDKYVFSIEINKEMMDKGRYYTNFGERLNHDDRFEREYPI